MLAATEVNNGENRNQINTVTTDVRSQEVTPVRISSSNAKPKSKRKPISIKTKRILLKKAQHQCEFAAPNGQRCKAHSMLEIDHIHPVSQGGLNDFQNLRIYCRAHNQARETKTSDTIKPHN